MLSYLFLFFTVVIFSALFLVGIKHWVQRIKHPLETYLVLVIDKYMTDENKHLIVVQLRDVETTYEISAKLYRELQPPIRGELTVEGQNVISFK